MPVFFCLLKINQNCLFWPSQGLKMLKLDTNWSKIVKFHIFAHIFANYTSILGDLRFQDTCPFGPKAPGKFFHFLGLAHFLRIFLRIFAHFLRIFAHFLGVPASAFPPPCRHICPSPDCLPSLSFKILPF